DGAFAGEPRQTALVAKIVAAVSPVPVQMGGGLRDLEAVGLAFETGARWAIVGTRAALDPEFLREVCRTWPARVIVAVDGRGWGGLADARREGGRGREPGRAWIRPPPECGGLADPVTINVSQARHPVPRRQGRPGRQGCPLRGPARRGRPGRGRARVRRAGRR